MTEQKFGIFDVEDKCWLGDDAGPALYEDEVIAKIAAQVQGVRLGYGPTRLEHRPFHGGPTKFKDSVDAKMDGLTALKKIEEGGTV